MSKANIIRTAFSTLAEAYLIEGRKKMEAGMTPLQKRASRDRQAGNGLIDIGHLRRVRAKNLNRQYPGTKDTIPYRDDPHPTERTAGEIFSNEPKKAKKVLASRLASGGSTTNIRAGALNKTKEYGREDSSTMNYRQSIRALFEAVIEEAAVRTPKKVRGALEKDERGIATQDGPEELVADIKNRHPANSPIGRKARQMAYRYRQERGEAAEKQRNQDAADAAEWDEMDREHSDFFRGGRSRGLVK